MRQHRRVALAPALHAYPCYENGEKYTMIPEVGAGFNSNSFFRGVIEYAGFSDSVVVPSCFRAPGLSKILTIA
jgi:hypothetical protein